MTLASEPSVVLTGAYSHFGMMLGAQVSDPVMIPWTRMVGSSCWRSMDTAVSVCRVNEETYGGCHVSAKWKAKSNPQPWTAASRALIPIHGAA
jgi:hypothetical protein